MRVAYKTFCCTRTHTVNTEEIAHDTGRGEIEFLLLYGNNSNLLLPRGPVALPRSSVLGDKFRARRAFINKLLKLRACASDFPGKDSELRGGDDVTRSAFCNFRPSHHAFFHRFKGMSNQHTLARQPPLFTRFLFCFRLKQSSSCPASTCTISLSLARSRFPSLCFVAAPPSQDGVPIPKTQVVFLPLFLPPSSTAGAGAWLYTLCAGDWATQAM